MGTRTIVIVLGRCSRGKQGFGIRFERKGASQWLATWAFAINESAAKKEGYEKAKMHGQFALDDAFPGCPHCSAHGFFLCGCGRIGCCSGGSQRVACPWCGQSGALGGEINSLEGGGDR